MALKLPDAWTWDMWFADDGELHHVFYLKASRALHDERRRHYRASVGHAVSTDLRKWEEVDDVMVASDGPAFDDLAIWTGSVIQGPDDVWRFFYTGCSRRENGLVQRIGVATSNDLYTWHARSSEPLLEADARWYERLDAEAWENEAWRDPWVYSDPLGNGWHMLITARAASGSVYERGVVGHATSSDLETWEVQPPLSEAGTGFGQLEVLQIAQVEGRNVLLFGCLQGELSVERRARGERGGIWSLPIDDPLGPFDITRATRLTDHSLYCGKLVQDHDGVSWLMAFNNYDRAGEFLGGGLADPLPVAWGEDGILRVADGRFDRLAPTD
jgi:beta-fructofuranosidase